MTIEKRNKRKNDKNKTGESPVVVSNLEISETPKQTTEIAKQEYKPIIEILPIKEGRHERRNANAQVISAFLTLISIVLIYIMTSEQNKISNNTLRFQVQSDSINRIKDSINMVKQDKKDSITIAIAETSSAINQRSVNSSEHTARIQTSPYIDYSFRITEPLEVGKDFAFEIDFRNTGQTPAYNFSSGIIWEYGTKSEIIEFEKKPVEVFRNNTVLQPTASITKYQRIDKSKITKEFIDNIKSKLWNLKIRIAFTYITKWGNVEKFEPRPDTYVLSRNLIMSINEN